MNATESAGLTIWPVLMIVVVLHTIVVGHKYGPSSNSNAIVTCMYEWMRAHFLTWPTTATCISSVHCFCKYRVSCKKNFIIPCKFEYGRESIQKLWFNWRNMRLHFNHLGRSEWPCRLEILGVGLAQPNLRGLFDWSWAQGSAHCAYCRRCIFKVLDVTSFLHWTYSCDCPIIPL